MTVSVIEFYQKYLSFDHGMLAFLAPGGACKYEVSCSQYTKQMVARYGILKGLARGIKRIWRCR